MNPELPLSAAFLAHVTQGTTRWGEASELLEETLRQAYEGARKKWPGLEVQASTYGGYLAERVPAKSTARDAKTAVEEMVTDDLYLACACHEKVPGAVEAFIRDFLQLVPTFVRSRNLDGAQIDDLKQLTYERLFLGTGRSGPQIGKYKGKAQLVSWLHIVVLHLVCKVLPGRKRPSTSPEKDEFANMIYVRPDFRSHVVEGTVLEDDLFQKRYKPDLDEALSAALAGLDEPSRKLLCLRYLRGLSLKEMAALYGKNAHTTIKRRLDAIYARVCLETKKRLKERLNLSSNGIDELVNSLLSKLHLSIERQLKNIDEREDKEPSTGD